MASQRMKDFGIKFSVITRNDKRFIQEEEKYQHPLYRINNKYEAIKEDMAVNGFDKSDPITVDCFGYILKGHTRRRIAKELGIIPYFVVKDFPVDEGEETDKQRRTYAYSENLNHRDITEADRRIVAQDIIKMNPHFSDRQIGALSGMSNKTIGNYRRQMESAGEIEKVTERTGQDGKK